MTAGLTVIGIGNLYRRDDGVGLIVTELVREAVPDIDAIQLDGEPARLIEAWSDRAHVVVVDASSSGAEAGTIRRIADIEAEHVAPTRVRSSHSPGVADAHALGRALERLPECLEVIAIEGADFGEGEGLSSKVAVAARVVANGLVNQILTGEWNSGAATGCLPDDRPVTSAVEL